MPKHTFTYRVAVTRDVKYVVSADNRQDAESQANRMLGMEHRGQEYLGANFTLLDYEVEETTTVPFPSNIQANG